MKNIKVNAKVQGIEVDSVEFGGLFYTVINAEIAGIDKFKVFVPMYNIVHEGQAFSTEDYVLTRYIDKDKKEHLAIRVNQFTVLEEYVPNQLFTSVVIGSIIKSDKSQLQGVGPRKTPFYRCTLRIKDDSNSKYSILLVGFNDMAFFLSNAKRATLVRATVDIRRQKYKDDWELCLSKCETLEEEEVK